MTVVVVVWQAAEAAARAAAAAADAATAAIVASTTKPCPRCRVPIFKDGGCSHMTCVRAERAAALFSCAAARARLRVRCVPRMCIAAYHTL